VDIYYPLEGYLYPDTYIFTNSKVSVNEIFNIVLNQTDKILSEYKTQIQNSGLNVNQVLTIASIVELEGKTEIDRRGISRVICNRLKNNMKIGSDVTTYYGIKVDMSERDLKVSELKATNAYNTRSADMAGKLPVSPICSVGAESIDAAINPTSTDNLFFVADKFGKVYYAKTDAEHQANIKKLKDSGNWYTYDN
jgi:UPF0755 protein